VASPEREAADGAGVDAADLAARLRHEIEALDAELAEIDMLISQARTEAGRHEQKRVQTSERLTTSTNLPTDDVIALNSQLVTLTRRASVMEAQVEVLEGKRKTLARFRDMLIELAASYGGIALGRGPADGGASVPRLGAGAGAGAGSDAPMSRIVLNAQEDLRREIARAMHDGPAQSLTNIVLQAQIVERLLTRDPEGARGELRLLVQMVQQTLDATKTFIFDVRPMVLDDLGLVPTLRRAARERGRRANIPVDFDSMGADRRLAVDLESSLFRIVDEALGAYLGQNPDRVTIRLDWSDSLVEVEVGAERDPTEAMAAADRVVSDTTEAAANAGKDVPPAIEAMLADRRRQAEDAAAAARSAAVVTLPAGTWREIEQRAVTTGIVAEQSNDGSRLQLRADLSPATGAAAGEEAGEADAVGSPD
jgi:two-component system, NarL family, sensor histidine kinase DegS